MITPSVNEFHIGFVYGRRMLQWVQWVHYRYKYDKKITPFQYEFCFTGLASKLVDYATKETKITSVHLAISPQEERQTDGKRVSDLAAEQ